MTSSSGEYTTMIRGVYGKTTVVHQLPDGTTRTDMVDGVRIRSLPSEKCGAEFDAYVERALKDEPPLDNSWGPDYRTIQSLWPGRKLRLLTDGRKNWKQGRVVEWNQGVSGPYSPCTQWLLTVELLVDEEENYQEQDAAKLYMKGDLVEILGLQNATQHNCRQGTIQKYMADSGRYMVAYTSFDDEKRENIKHAISVKPANLQRVTTLEREVGRVNVNGGGTLEGDSKVGAKSMRFEWLEPAVPDPAELLVEE